MIQRVLPRFGGDPSRQQSAAARALDIHASSINRLVNEGRGGSVDMIERVEKMLNEPRGTILGYGTGGPATPRFRDLPGFSGAVDEATRRAQDNKIQVSRHELENVGDFTISPVPQRITPDLLIQLALALTNEPTGKKPSPKR
jgi:hypothetical protein